MEKANPYCERLGIEPPSLKELSRRWRLTLRESIILALLERGAPMDIETLIERLEGTFPFALVADPRRSIPCAWAGREPIYKDLRGRYGLDIHSHDLHVFLMTAKLRDGLHPALRPLIPFLRPGDKFDFSRAEISKMRAIARRDEADAVVCRRAILRVLPDAKRPAALGLIDATEGEVRTFLAGEGEFGVAAKALHGYDVLAGLTIRDAVAALGVDPDDFILRDLGRVKRERRRKWRSRRPKPTPEQLISSTTGIESPLTPTIEARRLVRAGRGADLRKHLRADLVALLGYYRFGVLHRHVRHAWEGVVENLDASWHEPGDLTYYEQVRAAIDDDRALEVVLGSPPDPKDPWWSARRVRPVGGSCRTPKLVDLETGRTIPEPATIQAMRLV